MLQACDGTALQTAVLVAVGQDRDDVSNIRGKTFSALKKDLIKAVKCRDWDPALDRLLHRAFLNLAGTTPWRSYGSMWRDMLDKRTTLSLPEVYDIVLMPLLYVVHSSGEDDRNEASSEERGDEASGDEASGEASGDEASSEASDEASSEASDEASSQASGAQASGEQGSDEASGNDSSYEPVSSAASSDSFIYDPSEEVEAPLALLSSSPSISPSSSVSHS